MNTPENLAKSAERLAVLLGMDFGCQLDDAEAAEAIGLGVKLIGSVAVNLQRMSDDLYRIAETAEMVTGNRDELPRGRVSVNATMFGQ